MYYFNDKFNYMSGIVKGGGGGNFNLFYLPKNFGAVVITKLPPSATWMFLPKDGMILEFLRSLHYFLESFESVTENFFSNFQVKFTQESKTLQFYPNCYLSCSTVHS